MDVGAYVRACVCVDAILCFVCIYVGCMYEWMDGWMCACMDIPFAYIHAHIHAHKHYITYIFGLSRGGLEGIIRFGIIVFGF
jgi:hypothetical protein